MTIADDRFARLEAIEWWDQSTLSALRVLVVGAGALGNEVLKNLALLGVRRVVVADMDTIETSNLSRSVLFRAADAGAPKAATAARAYADLCPGAEVEAWHGNVCADLGLGWFADADVVIGALDNREARVFVNRACALTGRVWFDGGLDVLNGVVRGFAPPDTACYECTMSAADWAAIEERRSCALLARRAAQAAGVPTTPTIASIIGALQVQEMVKWCHGHDALLGAGYVVEGAQHASYRVTYDVRPTCGWHGPPPALRRGTGLTTQHTARDVIDAVAPWLDAPIEALDLSRDVVTTLWCAVCDREHACGRPLDALDESQVRCPTCHDPMSPTVRASIDPAGATALRPLAELGVPPRDIIMARTATTSVGIVLDDPIASAPEIHDD